MPVTPATEPATVRPEAPGQLSQEPNAPSPTVPETLPDVTLPDSGGTPRSLAELEGQAADHQFLGDLVRAVPGGDSAAQRTLRKERAADKLEVIGIAIDEQPRVTRSIAKEISIQYPVLMGEQEGYEAAEKFGVASLVLPFSVFVDSQGRIVTLKVGELHPAPGGCHTRPREGCGRQSALVGRRTTPDRG